MHCGARWTLFPDHYRRTGRGPDRMTGRSLEGQKATYVLVAKAVLVVQITAALYASWLSISSTDFERTVCHTD